MYRVIEDFADLQDHEYIYHAGDEFPRFGVSVSDERIAELSSWSNKIGRPLIEKAQAKKVDIVKQETEQEQEPKRRGRRKAND